MTGNLHAHSDALAHPAIIHTIDYLNLGYILHMAPAQSRLSGFLLLAISASSPQIIQGHSPSFL